MFLVINYLHAWRPNVDVRERESSVLIHVHTVPLMCIKYVYIIYIYIAEPYGPIQKNIGDC